jgi:hypothetical protein
MTIIKTDVYQETSEKEPDEIVLPLGPPNLLKLSLEHFQGPVQPCPEPVTLSQALMDLH